MYYYVDDLCLSFLLAFYLQLLILACVPLHTTAPAPSMRKEKFELADGQRICVSRGGFKEGEAARKIELARKGLL